MMNYKLTCLFACSTIAFVTSCSNGPDKPPLRTNLKIVSADSLTLNYEDNERRLSESTQELCAVLISDNKDCANTIILEPSIYRTDLKNDFSLKTNIEKGGSKDVSNPKVIGRLIKKNLEGLNIPKEFSKPYSGKNAATDISSYVQTKAGKDSILVLIPDGSADTYVLNGKSYKAVSDVEEVRNRMLAILCQNQKANFTLLINPPAQTSIPDTSPPTTTAGPRQTKPQTKKVSVVNRGGSHTRPIGDLTILKGSEGCDLCTRYYSAYDATGHLHEIKEKNSVNCCPCNKTVEIRGQTFVMNCDGSPRLQPVE